ncbi:MAG: hypothetical protein KBD29_00305 [Candidatus Magasanikbacteria bacterium]|nr:hypothetical protein [Candidatus Magasanikbacteria bacterium]
MERRFAFTPSDKGDLDGFITDKYSKLPPEQTKAIRLFVAHNRDKHSLSADDVEVFASYVIGAGDSLASKVSISPRDRAYVEDLESRFSADKKSEEGRYGYPKILEAVLTRQIELANWFGDDAITFQTHEYDDYVGGVDMVIEWPGDGDGEPIRLAIDVTLASNIDTIANKIMRGRQDIEQGKSSTTKGKVFLSQVKYYVDPNTEEQISLEMVPKVIIGTDIEGIKRLVQKAASVLRKVPGANQKFSNDPCQFLFLKEVRVQLERQLWFSTLSLMDGMAKRNPDIKESSVYDDIYNLLERHGKENASPPTPEETAKLISLVMEHESSEKEMLGKDVGSKRRVVSFLEIARVYNHIKGVLSEKEESLGNQMVAEAGALEAKDQVASAINRASWRH